MKHRLRQIQRSIEDLTQSDRAARRCERRDQRLRDIDEGLRIDANDDDADDRDDECCLQRRRERQRSLITRRVAEIHYFDETQVVEE